MEEYIHLQNLILFKKRLTEAHSDAEREVLLKLLAEKQKSFHEKWHSQAALICTNEPRLRKQ